MKQPGQDDTPSEQRLGFSAALSSPCDGCITSPCCTHVPLHSFKVENLAGLDHIRYLINFRRIEVGLSANGNWSVMYRHPCRYLETIFYSCTVHDREEQPSICVHYSPHTCWYKQALSSPVSDSFLRLDERRLQFVTDHVVFDEDRNIVEVPSWSAIAHAMADYEPSPIDDSAIESDAAFDTWLGQAASGAVEPPPEKAMTYAELADPCPTCSSYCCKYLVFPGMTPTSASSLDYMQFLLGFPGLEIGIADGGWSLVVKADCQHLRDDRCGLHGLPERPLLCKYYDAHACDYRVQFGMPRPPGLLRIRLEQWPWVVELFRFDSTGAVVSAPPTDELRAHLEQRLREHALQRASDGAEG